MGKRCAGTCFLMGRSNIKSAKDKVRELTEMKALFEMTVAFKRERLVAVTRKDAYKSRLGRL